VKLAWRGVVEWFGFADVVSGRSHRRPRQNDDVGRVGDDADDRIGLVRGLGLAFITFSWIGLDWVTQETKILLVYLANEQ